MFLGKIIFYTCDLHLKLDILNPLDIIFWSNGLKKSLLPCNPFLPNFKTFKFLYDLVFHRRGHVFVVQKV